MNSNLNCTKTIKIQFFNRVLIFPWNNWKSSSVAIVISATVCVEWVKCKTKPNREKKKQNKNSDKQPMTKDENNKRTHTQPFAYTSLCERFLIHRMRIVVFVFVFVCRWRAMCNLFYLSYLSLSLAPCLLRMTMLFPCPPSHTMHLHALSNTFD